MAIGDRALRQLPGRCDAGAAVEVRRADRLKPGLQRGRLKPGLQRGRLKPGLQLLPRRCNAAALLAVLVAAFPAGGCGSQTPEAFSRAAIDGTVTLDSAPLDDAIIRFIPTGQTPGPKTFFVVREGKFQATTRDGPPLGTHRVEIQPTDEGEFAHDDEQALQRLSQTPRPVVQRSGVPDVYRSRSPLEAELLPSAGDKPQVLEFSLSSGAR